MNNKQITQRACKARRMAAHWATELMHREGTDVACLAKRSGVSPHTVRKLLTGRTAELRTLEKIADAAGVEVPKDLAAVAYKRRDWRGMRTLNGRVRPEFTAFRDMHRRVSEPSHPDYRLYGGRGIKIHPEWRMTPEGFQKFLSDLGPRPSPEYSLHRTPPTANYGPTTCVWADKSRQNLEKCGKLLVQYNEKLMGIGTFQRLAEADGFLLVIKRNPDGTLKKRRRSKEKPSSKRA